MRGAAAAIGAVNTVVVEEDEEGDGDDEREGKEDESANMVSGSERSEDSSERNCKLGLRRSEIRRRRLVGYNTDWIGIMRPVQRLLNVKERGRDYQQQLQLQQHQQQQGGGVGLVIGAGLVLVYLHTKLLFHLLN